jgi:peroxiredoxin
MKPKKIRLISVGLVLSLLGVVDTSRSQLVPPGGGPEVGQKAPDFPLKDMSLKPVKVFQLFEAPGFPRTGQPAEIATPKTASYVLMVFYRGYWCPRCNLELLSLQENLERFAALGVRIVAVSTDAPELTLEHTKKLGFTYTFLSDQNARITRYYHLLVARGGVGGSDIAFPAELLVDSTGTVRWFSFYERRKAPGAAPVLRALVKDLGLTPLVQ